MELRVIGKGIRCKSRLMEEAPQTGNGVQVMVPKKLVVLGDCDHPGGRSEFRRDGSNIASSYGFCQSLVEKWYALERGLFSLGLILLVMWPIPPSLSM